MNNLPARSTKEWVFVFIQVMASTVFLMIVLWIYGAELYWDVFGNKEPPIKVGAITVGGDNIVRRGEEVYAAIPMQWDKARDCSARVTVKIRGPRGEIYPGPPDAEFSSEEIKKALAITDNIYWSVIKVPQIATIGMTQVLPTGRYRCKDNQSRFDGEIVLERSGAFQVVE